MSSLRIVHAIARLNVGGAALHVLQLAREQERRGHDVLVVAGTLATGEESMVYMAEQLGVRIHELPALQRELSPRADLAAIRDLRRVLRATRPDVLHTHTSKAGATGRIAALTAGKARPRAVVHTYHGHVLRGYFDQPRERAFRLIERLLARSADALIAVSDEVRNDLVRFGVAPSERFVVVPYGFDLPAWSDSDEVARERIRGELGAGDGTFVVGWAGRFTAIKRPLDLPRTLRALVDEGIDAMLVLVGDGEKRAETEALAHELGVWERCRFAGFQQGIRGWHAAFDALLLTSENEGAPVVAIEALAAERPVVATDAGGTATVVTEGKSGFLERIGDTKALGARLATLARDPELAAELGRYGAEDMRARFAMHRMTDDVEALYRRLLAPAHEKRAPSPPLTPALAGAGTIPLAPEGDRLRIVLVSQYFPPEVGATQSRMQAFAEFLAARGHQVTVICEFPNHPHGVIPESYRGRVIDDDRSNGYRVLRVWVMASAEKTQRTRVQFYLSYMALATAVSPLAGHADVVVATSPPLFSGLAGAAIARLNRAPLVLDVRDLWPAAAVSLDQISSGLAIRFSERVERFLYKDAAVVTTVTHPFCEHIDALRPRGPRSVLIPNGTLDLFFGDSDRSARAQLGVDDDTFLVTFAGTHGIAQGLPSVLQAAALLDGSAHLAFVGDGPVKQQLVAQAARQGLTNVSFHSQVPLEEMPAIFAASDALLVPLSAHPTFTQFVPSKMIDSMAARRPVLLSAAGESARILERVGAGVAVPPEDPAALADAINWLGRHREEAEAMGERGRDFARTRLRSTQAERLEQVLRDVTGTRIRRRS